MDFLHIWVKNLAFVDKLLTNHVFRLDPLKEKLSFSSQKQDNNIRLVLDQFQISTRLAKLVLERSSKGNVSFIQRTFVDRIFMHIYLDIMQ